MQNSVLSHNCNGNNKNYDGDDDDEHGNENSIQALLNKIINNK